MIHTEAWYREALGQDLDRAVENFSRNPSQQTWRPLQRLLERQKVPPQEVIQQPLQDYFTRLLDRFQGGDAGALEDLFSIVNYMPPYGEHSKEIVLSIRFFMQEESGAPFDFKVKVLHTIHNYPDPVEVRYQPNPLKTLLIRLRDEQHIADYLYLIADAITAGELSPDSEESREMWSAVKKGGILPVLPWDKLEQTPDSYLFDFSATETSKGPEYEEYQDLNEKLWGSKRKEFWQGWGSKENAAEEAARAYQRHEELQKTQPWSTTVTLPLKDFIRYVRSEYENPNPGMFTNYYVHKTEPKTLQVSSYVGISGPILQWVENR